MDNDDHLDKSSEGFGMSQPNDRRREDEKQGNDFEETSFNERLGDEDDSEGVDHSAVQLYVPTASPIPLAEDGSFSLILNEAASLSGMQPLKDDCQHNYGYHEHYELEPVEDCNMVNGKNMNSLAAVRNVRIEPATFEDIMPSGTLEVEEGRRTEELDYECSLLGPLNDVGTTVAHFFIKRKRSLTGAKILIFVLAVIGLLGFVVFLGVFPNSFRYIEYYELALKKSKFTGAVDRSRTYLPGCYVLGPDAELVFFDGVAHNVDLTISIFTRDKLVITISFHLQYFIKPDELGELHKKFEKNYNPVLLKIIESTVKNEAAQFSVEEYRLNRTKLERHFHNSIRRRVGGNCCMSCCTKSCHSDPRCIDCQTPGSCDRAYHVDVRYFQMSRISIPDDVFERFLKQTLLKVEVEREVFYQEHALIVKETDRQVEAILNEALVIIQSGTAQGELITAIAEADYEVTVQTSYAKALKLMFSQLNITQADHQLSLMMIRALDDMKDSIYQGFAYDVYKTFSP